MVSTELSALYARDLLRVVQELRAFPDTDAVWKTAPGVTNAAGTLALHLEGNLREFVGHRIGGVAYTRDRPLEFSARGVPQSDLIARFEAVQTFIPGVIAGLSEDTLSAMYPEPVLGAPLTNRAFIIALLGHLNYHLGQIDYLRRVATGNGAIELASLAPQR